MPIEKPPTSRSPASDRPTRSRHSSTRLNGMPGHRGDQPQVAASRSRRVETRRLEHGSDPHGGIGKVAVVVAVDEHRCPRSG